MKTFTRSITLALLSILLLGVIRVSAQNLPVVPFTGEKTDWHGYDRYDFVMDGETLAITPYKSLVDEKFEVSNPEKGQRRCIIVVPKHFAPGNPWSWRAVYWNHQPQTEVELLKRGFCVAYISATQVLLPNRTWDAWYDFLTEKHNLSKKPGFIGMSRGGEYEYIWATTHPDKVSSIYADNPGGANMQLVLDAGKLALNDVPVLQIGGTIDPAYGKYASAIEEIYHQMGGRISTMIKEGYCHHPHSLINPKPIADFIESSFYEKHDVPAFVTGSVKYFKTYYYSLATGYTYYPDEDVNITTRGPLFTPCYDKYEIYLPKVQAFSFVIAPKNPAPGNPWVFRADYVNRDAVVDQALLAKGYYIVTAANPYSDGPIHADWTAIYKYLTDNGFSKKPVIEGMGQATGEMYAWAIENPDKVSCIYGQNPILKSRVAKVQPLDNLEALAKAGIPILHVCGSLDIDLDKQTRVAEKRYKQMGGKLTTIIKPGEGHYFILKDTKPEVDFITGNTK